jgi:hypothetical protein
MEIPPEKNFGEDLAFLNEHLDTVVLRNSDGAAVVVVPAFQGRTMTSTANGEDGKSYGYINYDAIKSDKVDSQINLYGGEDRVWVSPEGGQNSIFFDPGVEMTFENWRTPPEIDSHAFTIQNQKRNSISLSKDALFTNWSGTKFRVQIDRTVKLLDRRSAGKLLDADLAKLQLVAHESHNTLVNRGTKQWQPETGLIGVWMICMSKPAPTATLVVPFKTSDEEATDSLSNEDIVTANYFGELDESRLKVDRNNSLLFFRGDGQLRSKLGINPKRAMPILGSWDRDRQVFSVIQFNLPESAPHGYNNNFWEIQDDPYAGDAVNCYNDGVNDSGSNMGDGGFYEMETISPALALSPDEGYTHIHRTFRMEGDRADLSAVAEKLFGVDLNFIESQFN